MTKTASVEVVGGAASVCVDETGFFGRTAFSNRSRLVKGEDGAWHVVSKLFASSPDPAGD